MSEIPASVFVLCYIGALFVGGVLGVFLTFVFCGQKVRQRKQPKTRLRLVGTKQGTLR